MLLSSFVTYQEQEDFCWCCWILASVLSLFGCHFLPFHFLKAFVKLQINLESTNKTKIDHQENQICVSFVRAFCIGKIQLMFADDRADIQQFSLLFFCLNVKQHSTVALVLYSFKPEIFWLQVIRLSPVKYSLFLSVTTNPLNRRTWAFHAWLCRHFHRQDPEVQIRCRESTSSDCGWRCHSKCWFLFVCFSNLQTHANSEKEMRESLRPWVRSAAHHWMCACQKGLWKGIEMD